VTWGAFKVADALHGARVDEEQELIGLDLANHEERGYDLG
jgi:Amt family ammonium transporter